MKNKLYYQIDETLYYDKSFRREGVFAPTKVQLTHVPPEVPIEKMNSGARQ